MLFQRFSPPKQLEPFVDCYWVIESDDRAPYIQKIIPDGFPEIIFHYGDPYRIRMDADWELQEKSLVAGQITRHFFLENTGAAGVLGIKFRPAGIAQLLSLSMEGFTDAVIPFSRLANKELDEWESLIAGCQHYTEMMDASNRFLLSHAARAKTEEGLDRSLVYIGEARGCGTMEQICHAVFITERQLQRLFKKYIGVPPKIYSRIIRFNHIFELLQQGTLSWMELTHLAGYFDQSHFIRDFRAFTGEDPTRYCFDAPNLANFFLKKTGR
jgi:AraC-like DNA-binding protein